MNEWFDDRLLEEFTRGFYGYGDYSARYWFVGMEEGGGNTFDEIMRRLNAWATRGKRELEDVAEYHHAVGITYLFNRRPKIQRTWNKLIRIVLSSQGLTPTTEQVREYQRDRLGRPGGETCLTELLPLPSRSTQSWFYASHSRLPYLANRETYRQTCLPWRMNHLRERIREHHPPVVVFYGFDYRKYWEEMAGIEFSFEEPGILLGSNSGSLFVIVKHPVARGMTNAYFHQVGGIVAAWLDQG